MITIKGIFLTEVVTLPRSGHHWTQQVLTDYFDGRLVTWQRGIPEPLPPETNLIRNLHDWDLSAPVLPDRQYLIQIRDPVDALASRWEFEQLEGQLWYAKMQEWLKHYTALMLKWVYTPIPNRLVLRYSDLVAAPLDRFAELINWLDAANTCQRERLVKILCKNPPKGSFRRPLDFPNSNSG